jgi:hypothetical protein
MGGAARARPENSPDDVRIRQTETGSCNSQDRGCHAHLEPRSGTHTGLRCRCGGAGAQISTNPASESRSATGPFPPPTRLPAGANRHRGQGLLRWLAWPAHAERHQRAASGNAVVSTSPPALPHVTPTSEGPSSRLARSVHDPSGSRSKVIVARVLGGGDETGWDCVAMTVRGDVRPWMAKRDKSRLRPWPSACFCEKEADFSIRVIPLT